MEFTFVLHVRLFFSSFFSVNSVRLAVSNIIFLTQLEAMGFDRAIVLEVYFACNKNEELAANYLLDHIHEYED